eukprot:782046-Ditylum_brightwellii.AAC.1
MEGSSSTSQRSQNDDKFTNESSSSAVSKNGATGALGKEGGLVYIDPTCDIDIAPCLDCWYG